MEAVSLLKYAEATALPHVETISLLKDTVTTTPQHKATQVNYPCTGFCYFVVPYIDTLVYLYINKKYEDYNKLVTFLIKKSGERKKNNKNIHYKGENIDDKTIQKDFPITFKQMGFKELHIVNSVSMEQASNELYGIISQIKQYIIFTRSDETIMMIKLNNDKLLVVDSHKEKHGSVDIYTAIKYINKFAKYKGTIDIGYF